MDAERQIELGQCKKKNILKRQKNWKKKDWKTISIKIKGKSLKNNKK